MKGMALSDVTPLHFACFLQSASVVVALMQGNNLDLNEPSGAYKSSPLHIAATFNNIGPVRELLKAGANPNVEDELGDTPLHSAVVNSSNDVIGPLVKCGTNLWKKNKTGKSMATFVGSTEIHLTTQLAVIEAAGCLDHREFLLTQDLPMGKPIHLDGVLKEKWAECTQFGITSEENCVVYVMIHQAHDHTRDNHMMKIGFMIISSIQSRFRLPSYKMNLMDYGKTEPFKLNIKSGEHYVICPYVKCSDGAGAFSLVTLSTATIQVH
jgi:hypothetical protein